ncbi:MAG: YbjN domain-containing protein [Armatimonadetes bacterium]|nr:YbjN domain-containing protein [Armatimonadota bacterium]
MATQVTLDLMKQYLERFGWSRYKAVEEPMEKEGIIHTGWRSSPDVEGFNLAIDPMVEKNCLSFRVPKILTVSLDETPQERLKDLMVAMGFINYRIILGKFAYDPRDGEVRFSVDIPIDENTVTYEQFEHCLGVVVKTVDEYAPKLEAIVKGKKTVKEFIADEMKSETAIAGGLLRLFRELLEAMERAHKGERREGESSQDQSLTEV